MVDHPFRFVLDVNHAFTNDPSMELARQLRAAIGHRLSHVHLSGFISLHDPLFCTKQTEILDAVPAGSPIVLESRVRDLAELAAELEYVRESLDRRLDFGFRRNRAASGGAV